MEGDRGDSDSHSRRHRDSDAGCEARGAWGALCGALLLTGDFAPWARILTLLFYLEVPLWKGFLAYMTSEQLGLGEGGSGSVSPSPQGPEWSCSG